MALAVLALSSVGALTAACSKTMANTPPPLATWTPTPPYNYSHVTAQSWINWVAPGPQSAPEHWLRVACRVEVGAGSTIAQATVIAVGPTPGESGATPQPTIIIRVSTPVAGTNPSSAQGWYERVFNLTSATPIAAPARVVNQHDKYRFSVTDTAGNTFAYIPLQNIFTQGTQYADGDVRGVLDFPLVTNVTGYATSTAGAPAVVTLSGGSVSIAWSCVADATLYLVHVVNLTDVVDLGWSTAIRGDADCSGTSGYTYPFPAVTLKTYAVTILATDMRWDMWYPGRDPLSFSDQATSTFYVRP